MSNAPWTDEPIPPPSGAAPANDVKTSQRVTPPSYLPAFPVNALPDAVKAFVVALADSLEVAPDMTATFALGALSASLIGKLQVQPKQDWREPPILYVCIVADAGQRKSPALKQVFAPIYQIEIQEREEWKRECDRIDAHNAELEKGDPKEEKPPCPRFVMGDVTPEKLSEVLAEAENTRLACVSDEASVLEMASGTYSARPNLDVYLKGWDQSTLIVDRKMSGSLFVKAPSLAMVQCAQRIVFDNLARHPELRGKGLLPRFLFSVPPSSRGRRTHDRPPVDPIVRDAWNDLVKTLYKWKPGTADKPRIIHFDRLAFEEMYRFQCWLEKLIAPGSRFDGVGDMADKINGAMVRISLILWAAESSQEERDDKRAEISGSTVRKAIEIAKYFLRHNEHALVNLLSVKPGSDKAELLWAWIQRHGKAEFIIDRDFRQKGPRALRHSKEDTTAAANLLVDRGLLEPSGPGWIVVGAEAAE